MFDMYKTLQRKGPFSTIKWSNDSCSSFAFTLYKVYMMYFSLPKEISLLDNYA